MRINRAVDLTEHFTAVGDEYIKNLQLVRHAPDEDAIHDLRVAIRRLFAMIRACDGMLSDSERRRFLRKTRKLMRTLGKARDAQLKLVEIEKMRRIFRQLAPLLEDLSKERKSAEKKLAVFMRKYRPVEYKKILIKFSKEITDYGTRHEKGWQIFRDSIGLVVHDYQLVFMEKSRSIDINKPIDLHAVRKTGKKARYLLELLPALFGYESIGLEAIKGLQTMLGDIQDCHTLVVDIDEFLQRKWMYKESIEPIRNELEQKMKRLALDIPVELSHVAAALAEDNRNLLVLRQEELLNV